MNRSDPLLPSLNKVRGHLGWEPLVALSDPWRLREDLSLDSLALAEWAVRLEAETGVDVFAEGLVRTVGEVRERLGERQL
jgi:hypothetical protein